MSGRPVLIVLDNCEHLAAAVAGLTEQLLAACPALSILATSREPLGVEGERSWPVPPLSLPPSPPGDRATAGPPAAAALAASDAVRLFEQRAQLVRPLNESAHRELMSCWERLGETARAVRHYEQLAGMLRDQVGVPPTAETTALYQRLAGH